jgi:putative membrane protein
MKKFRMLRFDSALATFCLAGATILPVHAQDGAATGTGGAGTANTSMAGSNGGTSASGQSADTTAMMANMSSNTGLSASQRADFDRLFLTKAAKGNLAEVMTSQLALQKSKNPQVRQIAQQMVTEHSRAQAELTAIMQRRGVAIPQTPGVMHTATYQQLQRSRGNNFDQLYLGAQAEAHEEAVSLYQSALLMVDDPDTRAYISRNLPSIVGHTQMIYTSARQANVPGIVERPVSFPLASMNGMGSSMMTTTNGSGHGTMGTGATGMGGMNTTGGGTTGGGTTGGGTTGGGG